MSLVENYWHLVGHVCDFESPQSYILTEFGGGHDVLVYRDSPKTKIEEAQLNDPARLIASGEIIATDNICPHRGTRMKADRCGKGILTCPYHGWTYQKGQLIIPRKERFNPEDLQKVKLKQYKVEWCGQFAFAGINPRMSLQEQLGDFYQKVSDISFSLNGFHGEQNVQFNNDWKVSIENALESYHVSMVHAQSLGKLQFKETWQEFTSLNSVLLARVGNETILKGLERTKRFFELKNPYEGYASYFLFPFTFISTTFGFSYAIQHFLPSENKTRFSTRLYKGRVKSANYAAMVEPFFDSAAQVNLQVFQEDSAVCEKVVKVYPDIEGLIYSQDEARIQHFHRHLSEDRALNQ